LERPEEQHVAKAIEQTKRGLTIGHVGFGEHGAGIGSTAQSVHDGDTVTVRAIGNASVRFLGIDTPEVSFQLPGSQAFTGIGSPDWAAFLTNPFDAKYGALALDEVLVTDLKKRLGPEAAAIHNIAAQQARASLIGFIETDRGATSKEDFRFFSAFAHEVMDRYGRLLGYINVDLPNTPKEQRPESYNERQLKAGMAFPYFIWPNVNPFRKQLAIVNSVPPSADAPVIQHESALKSARDAVRAARTGKLGIFTGPPLLEPFELRYLAGRRAPERWVIDLGAHGQWAKTILPPQTYFNIPTEDRLWVPEEYVPLFVEKGWKRG
jgi:endonuclease YncB( thermonuclease family)